MARTPKKTSPGEEAVPQSTSSLSTTGPIARARASYHLRVLLLMARATWGSGAVPSSSRLQIRSALLRYVKAERPNGVPSPQDIELHEWTHWGLHRPMPDHPAEAAS
jgi:hypothetical protein